MVFRIPLPGPKMVRPSDPTGRERSSVLSPVLLKPGTSVFSSSQDEGASEHFPEESIHQHTGEHPGFGP